jgi:hypothetical protein
VPEWSNGNSTPQNPRSSGNSNYGHRGADNETDPNRRDGGSAAEEAARALQVLHNALTEATRPDLRQTIAPGLQSMIDTANGAPVIDLGIMGAGVSNEESYRPDEAASGDESRGPGFTVDRKKRDSACQSDANGEYWNGERECFYRAMSWKEFDRLNTNRGLSLKGNGSELFATRVKEYSHHYLSGRKGRGKYDVLVEFELTPGTTAQFYDPNVGRRGKIPKGNRPGWHDEYLHLDPITGMAREAAKNVVHVKAEDGGVAHGLRQNTVNPYFNGRVLDARVIGVG